MKKRSSYVRMDGEPMTTSTGPLTPEQVEEFAAEAGGSEVSKCNCASDGLGMGGGSCTREHGPMTTPSVEELAKAIAEAVRSYIDRLRRDGAFASDIRGDGMVAAILPLLSDWQAGREAEHKDECRALSSLFAKAQKIERERIAALQSDLDAARAERDRWRAACNNRTAYEDMDPPDPTAAPPVEAEANVLRIYRHAKAIMQLTETWPVPATSEPSERCWYGDRCGIYCEHKDGVWCCAACGRPLDWATSERDGEKATMQELWDRERAGSWNVPKPADPQPDPHEFMPCLALTPFGCQGIDPEMCHYGHCGLPASAPCHEVKR